VFGPADAAAVVTAVRAGERARAARPDGAPAVGPTRLVEQLRTAVEDGRTVWLAYLDETGTVSERVVDPVGVDGGRLTAYDHRSSRTRSFALHRISRVAAAG
jgi:predicted DNA-binding transcriptional regulator YafY